MTSRSVTLGLLLAMLIACVTYFNDFVIHQTMFIATHLPVAVFGLLLVGLFAVGPLTRVVGLRAMSRGEIGVVVALGLAACAWPGSGFWRYTAGLVAMPGHLQQSKPDWQAQGVMSYVPGGSHEIAPGQVLDWPALARGLEHPGGHPPIVADLADALDGPARLAARRIAAADAPLREEARLLLRGINHALATIHPRTDTDETLAANRDALVAALPLAVAAAPPGSGVLLDGGRTTPEVERLLYGRASDDLIALDQIPWKAWWRPLRLWVGTALALGLACLCLALVVHPQWSHRELLSYPIVRFVTEISTRDAQHIDRRFPSIAYQKTFWIGLATVFCIHLLNGMDTWFQSGIRLDLTLGFGPLRTLFPNAARVALSFGAFEPRLYFAVVAFAFFLPRNVSFSIGIAHIAFIAVGAFMLSNGVEWGYEKKLPSKTNFLRFGAFLGVAIMILYSGRRYYTNVALSAIGGTRAAETPRYATWAFRGCVASLVAAVLLLITGGLDWDLAILLIALLMLSFLVLSRLVCETGAFFVTSAFYPATTLAGLLGFEAMGPTGFFLVAFASWALMADPREALMPYLATGLQAIDRGGASPGRSSGWLTLTVVASMLVAGVVTLGLQHQQGLVFMGNDYATRFVPSVAFDGLARELSAADALGTLPAAVSSEPISRFLNINMYDAALPWGTIGLVLVLACAAARLRIPWWPLHPILFAMWGTYSFANFSFSFLVGWLVKTLVVKLGGLRAFHSVKPLMVGLIGGELLAILLWAVVGGLYYYFTRLPPPVYQIYPG